MLRYPIVSPRDNCAGNLPQIPGVRSYGLRPANEVYDVFCYVERLEGEGHEATHNLKQLIYDTKCIFLISICLSLF